MVCLYEIMPFSNGHCILKQLWKTYEQHPITREITQV
jgi:hypothetical protein